MSGGANERNKRKRNLKQINSSINFSQFLNINSSHTDARTAQEVRHTGAGRASALKNKIEFSRLEDN
ncbi:hypothetical protein PoB_003955000 [Plakobranchus ocellatus]|uniref:Uncharacterized protein n=1 Tax=Plakobranchus ocellatus TaxID=259542 RepID=A0AAV4AXG1_9GAST|nr:hypothetical protein PoB_003955000 [Plakobranchus ocellatus]